MWGCHNHYAWEPQFQPDNQDDTVNYHRAFPMMLSLIPSCLEEPRELDQRAVYQN